MRLTKHEDGYIYGVFCSESKDTRVNDLSAAVAAAGIVRTKDLRTWERLENLKTLRSPQQRNVVLHPEFVDGKYAFYTRPMDDFIDTGSGGGVGFGLCDDITHAVIDEEIITSKRKYHTITEAKNGAGAVPIKTDKGWIHIAHGVRNTAAGLRYVVYAFATALEDPAKVIAEPGGFLIAPLGAERVGDVSNVVFKRERRCIYLLCVERYEAACGDNHNRQACGLRVQHTGGPTPLCGLCGTAVCIYQEKFGIYEIIVIRSRRINRCVHKSMESIVGRAF